MRASLAGQLVEIGSPRLPFAPPIRHACAWVRPCRRLVMVAHLTTLSLGFAGGRLGAEGRGQIISAMRAKSVSLGDQCCTSSKVLCLRWGRRLMTVLADARVRSA